MEKMARLTDSFYRGKKVFITGHTGFKGSWMCSMLEYLGADICGYALEPPTDPDLFTIAGTESRIKSVTGDIRDLDRLSSAVSSFMPDIVIHLAAQPLVIESYSNPVYTYETNVMGTVNILEAVRHCSSVKSFLNVTTDKVYENREWEWGYRETDRLNGYDPYSNSKSCSELVTDSYRKSFFDGMNVPVSTARAGNVIGGGDFADNRIIPDCIRAARNGRVIGIRNPLSVRPFQHVLEPVYAYLVIAMKQFEDRKYASCYNIGPDYSDCVSVGVLADIFCEAWGGCTWENTGTEKPVHEANFLKLDCSRIQSVLGIKPVWNIRQAVQKTVEWTKCWLSGEDMHEFMKQQIKNYLEGTV